jgi:uncharacterized protein (DUF1015 family)
MSFVRLESEGITIFPIHRLVHRLKDFSPATVVNRLSEYFQVEEIPGSKADQSEAVDKLMGLMKGKQARGENCFGLYFPALRTFSLLTLKPETLNAIQWPVDKSPVWRKLDVSVLQEVILGHILGIGEKELAEQTNLEYISFHREAIKTADAKAYQCVFLLNPTPIGHVKDVVEAGDILPQKSTHFHPKLMEGLVFAQHLEPV